MALQERNGGALALFNQLVASASMRRPRDDFEILADPEFMDKVTDVMTLLDSARFLHEDEHRYKVFTVPAFRRAFDRGLEALLADLTPEQFELIKNFDIDRWFYDIVRETEQGGDDSEDIVRMQQYVVPDNLVDIDWLDHILGLEHKCPGLVALLRSTLDSQQKLVEKKREQYKRMMMMRAHNSYEAQSGGLRSTFKAIARPGRG